MSVLLDGGCITVRAQGLSGNDLHPECVRLGLENSVTVARAKPSSPVQVTAETAYAFCG